MTLQATLLAAALALVPAFARADDMHSKKLTDAEVLQKLHHINQEEIKVGNLAQQKGASTVATDFASTLVRDHTRADQDVTALASKMNVDLNATKMHAEHQDKKAVHENKMDQLQKLSGKDFDRAFGQMMVNGHRHAIEMVKDARGTVQSVELKSMLDKLLPTLQTHEDMANDLLNKGGNTTSTR
jgi:putative membrane protein